MRRFRIHPAIGVTRMGNSRDEFYIGPETPGVPPNAKDSSGVFDSFRDASGAIRRQAARFRVFEYAEGQQPREVAVGGDVVDIEWRVHIANRKASFFVFDGQNGASDNYVTRHALDPLDQIKDDPARTNLRNASVSNRSSLEIDPGEVTLRVSEPGRPVELSNTNSAIPIESLGTVTLDGSRLIVLGGRGQSASTESPPRQLDEYASNDTWFDDAGDGSVKARVRLSDGTFVDADAAWVVVGPPDFAPGIGNVVTLYDTLWDLAVRELGQRPGLATKTTATLAEQQRLWAQRRTLKGFKPSFTSDIFPTLKRALDARQTHVSNAEPNFHRRLLTDWGLLSSLDPARAEIAKDAREHVFRRMRDPDSTEVNWKGMPKGLGDDYTPLGNDQDPRPGSFSSVTRVQYALLREWSEGNFVDDWAGTEPRFASKAEPSPDELDKAALENCVGGPFFPGIEVGWLVRVPSLYAEPFRLRIDPRPDVENDARPIPVGALEFRPGFFSQQMALPWQADFYDCHKERETDPDGNEHFFMWWTAQRPDDVFPSGGNARERWVRRFDDGLPADEADSLTRFARFSQMQQRWPELRFVSVLRDGRFEEEP